MRRGRIGKRDSDATIIKQMIRQELPVTATLRSGDFVNHTSYISGGASTGSTSGGGGGYGTVTSVDFAVPGIFTVSGNPITSSGTITLGIATQTANRVFASPDGATGVPAFRPFLNSDLPNSAVTPGTYVNPTVTVNSKGIVTSLVGGVAGYVSGNIVLSSPGGTYFVFSVTNAGALVTTSTTEPPFTDFVIKSPGGQNYRVTVNNAGAMITTATTDPATAYSSRIPYITRTEEDATYKYYATAVDNTLVATAAWRVWRRHKATQVITRADGNRNYDNVGSGLAALSYS